MSLIAGDLEIRKSSDLIETKINNINSSNNSAPLAKREEEDDDEDEDVFNNESTTEVTQTTETVKVNNNSEHNKGINDNNKFINDSNNNNKNKIESTSDQPQIIQTDEIITVVVNENCNGLIYRENLNDNYSNDKKIVEISESIKKLSSNENFPKSILCANSDNSERKSLLRKKSVSFEKNEEVKKFIVGEEIIDKQNPFRSALDESEKFRIVKNSKKSSIPTKSQNGSAFAPLASEENDFITKEEILKQSKYVQVYVKNPDKVLTYDRTVLDKLQVNGSANTDTKPQLQQQQQRIPVPLPRKSTNLNNSNKIPIVNKKIDKKEKKRNHKVRNPKYPDLSDIKVKIGTDIDESLYDPNEVVLNAKKFDSRFKKIKFGSTDDLEEIVDKEDTTVVNSEEKETKVEEGEEGNEKKSYTNTVNSEEFRQYLKKKGLVLFPIKTSSNGIETKASNKKQLNGSAVLRKQQKTTDTLKPIDEIDFADMDGERNNGKKKSVFHRLSSIFSTSKGKTTPKTNEPLSRISYSSSTNNKNHYNHQHDNNGGNLGSNIKRVILERSNFNNGDNRSVSANSEFMQHFNSPSSDMQIKQQQQQPQPQQNNHHSRYNESDDTKSSISSVLTAAADDDPLDTPINVRKTNNTNQIANGRPVSANATAAMLYRNIDLTRSKLYQSKVKQNNSGNKNEMNGSEIYQQQQAQPQHYSSTTMNNGTRENDDIIKPRVQRPSNLSRTQPVNKSLIKPPVPLRRSIERQSMPIMRSGERYKQNSMEQNRITVTSSSDNERTPNNSYINGTIDKVTSTPTNDENMKATLKSPKMSPIVNLQAPQQQQQQQQQKPSEIDPITFAKIHEIKKKTDEVLLNKTNQLYTRPVDMKILQNNLRQQQQQNFVRNSPQRATITDVYQNKNSKRDDCGNEFMTLRQSQQQQNHLNLQPQRSQSVLDNMTINKNSLYGEVTYRRPDGSNVNVLMRRPESSTMDRNQIMQKIYEYYRKSVNNTPVSFTENSQKNLQYKTQSTDTSPVSYASVNTMRSTLPKIPQNQILQLAQTSTPRSSSYYSDYSIDRKGYFYNRPSSVSTTNSLKSARNQTISESDSVFLPPTSSSSNCENEQQPTHYVVVNSEKLRPFDVLKMQQYNNNNHNNSAKDHRRALYVEPERIYDVVYGASSANSTLSSRKENASENASGPYGNITTNNKTIDRSQKLIQRPASAMGGSTPSYQQQNRHMANGRMTPLILQTPQGDIIYNNQIYRPVSTIPRQQQQPQQQQQQTQQPPQQNQPIYSSPMRRRQNSNNNYESDSEAGEIQSIMQRKYGE